jgi:hypothetical protein
VFGSLGVSELHGQAPGHRTYKLKGSVEIEEPQLIQGIESDIDAYDSVVKERVKIINPRPVYTTFLNGIKRYRLIGKSKYGNNVSQFVSEATAMRYGVPEPL